MGDDPASNVIKFYTSANPDDVLDQAKGEFEDVLIIGWAKDGTLDARASNFFEPKGAVFHIIETFKHEMLCGVYDKPEDKSDE